MRQVGQRRDQPVTPQASGLMLAQAARFNESMAQLSASAVIHKGVYRFRTHEEANQQLADGLAYSMGRLAAQRLV